MSRTRTSIPIAVIAFWGLLPLVGDPHAPWTEAAVATVGRGTHTVFSRRWRYVRYFDGSEELYDLLDDPVLFDYHAEFGISEQNDLAAEHADVVVAVRSYLDRSRIVSRRVTMLEMTR